MADRRSSSTASARPGGFFHRMAAAGVAGLLAIFVVGLTAIPASAAATGCVYSGGDTVTLTIDATPTAALAIGKTSGSNIDWSAGGGAYAQCGTATTANTTTIVVDGTARQRNR